MNNKMNGDTCVSGPSLLTVNWTPMAVTPPPPVRAESRRWPRPREADCDRPGTPRVGGPGGDATCAGRRVWRGSNFARPAPQPPEPTATVRRKQGETSARLLRQRTPWRDGDGVVGRIHVHVQCVDMAGPGGRTLAVQTHADAAAQTYTGHFGTRPWVPVVQRHAGWDAGTQVTSDDLTDRMAETERLTEPLVAGAIEQATVAVLYEDDAAVLRAQQAACATIRRAERVRMCTLECRERTRRLAGLRALAAAELGDHRPAFRAVHGRASAAVHAAGACADAVDQLATAGYLRYAGPLDGCCRSRPARLGHHLLDALVGETVVNRSLQLYRLQHARSACSDSTTMPPR